MPRTRSLLAIAAIAALLGGGAGTDTARDAAPMAYNRNGAFGSRNGRSGGKRKSQGKRSGRGRR